MKSIKERLERLVSVLLVITMVITTNGMMSFSSTIKRSEEVVDEIVDEKQNDKYYLEYKEEINTFSKEDIDEDIVLDEIEEEVEDKSEEATEATNEEEFVDEVVVEESKKYEGNEIENLPDDFIDEIEDEIEEDEDINKYTKRNNKETEKEETKKEVLEEKVDEIENVNNTLYGSVKIKEVLIKNNENNFDSDAWITTRDDADYYLSPISDVVVEDENKNKKVVQVAIKWVEDFDREEVKEIMDSEKEHNFKLKYKIDKNELKNEVKKAIENNEVYDYESRKVLNAFMDEDTSKVLRGGIRDVGISELGEEGKLDGGKIDKEDEDIIEDDVVSYGKEENLENNDEINLNYEKKLEKITKNNLDTKGKDDYFENDKKVRYGSEFAENKEIENKPYTVEDAEKDLSKFIRNKSALVKAVELEKDSYINDYSKIEEDIIEDDTVFYGSEDGNNNEISFDEEYDEIEADMNVKYYAKVLHKHFSCGGWVKDCEHKDFKDHEKIYEFTALKETSKIERGGCYYLKKNCDWLDYFRRNRFISSRNIELYICLNGYTVRNFYAIQDENDIESKNLLALTNCQMKSSHVYGIGGQLTTNFDEFRVLSAFKNIYLFDVTAIDTYYSTFAFYNTTFTGCKIACDFKTLSLENCILRITRINVDWADLVYLRDVDILDSDVYIICDNIRISGKVDISHLDIVKREHLIKTYNLFVEQKSSFTLTNNAVERVLIEILSDGGVHLGQGSIITMTNNKTSAGIEMQFGAKIYDYGASVYIKNNSSNDAYNPWFVPTLGIIKDTLNKKEVLIYPKFQGATLLGSQGAIVPNGVWDVEGVFFMSYGDDSYDRVGSGIIYKDLNKTKVTHKFKPAIGKCFGGRDTYQEVVKDGNDLVTKDYSYYVKFNKTLPPSGENVSGNESYRGYAVGVKANIDYSFKCDNFEQIGWAKEKGSKVATFAVKGTYNSLSNRAGEVVNLYPVWKIKEQKKHVHKECGTAINKACRHEGIDSHIVGLTYTPMSRYTAEINYDGIELLVNDKIIIPIETEVREAAYYLTNDIDYDKIVHLNSYNVLHICLNGHTLKGINFTGSGTVYITNCTDKVSTISQYNGQYMFNGVKGIVETPKRITVKTASITSSENLTAWNVDFTKSSDVVQGNSIVAISKGAVLNNVTIKGYKTTKTFMSVGGNLETYGTVEISGNKQTGTGGSSRGFINLSSELRVNGDFYVKSNEMDKLTGTDGQYIINVMDSKKWTVKGNIEITGNKFINVTREDNNLMAVRVGSSGKIEVADKKINISGNTVNGTYKIYQVYSYNSDGFISQISGKFVTTGSKMEVGFANENGEGYIYKNWTSTTVDNVNKYNEVFTASNIKNLGVKVQYDGKDIVVSNSYNIEYKIGNPVAHNDSITYEKGGETKGHTAKINEDVKLSECGFYVDGFTFVGWSRTIDGSDGDVATETHSPYTEEVGKKVTLYAIWKQNTYKIKYEGGYGQSLSDGEKYPTGSMQTQTVYSGEKVKLSNDENGFTLEGFDLYSFELPDGTWYEAGGETDPISSKYGDEITLTAKWREKRYNVTLLKGGDGTFEISGEEKEKEEYRYYTKVDMINEFTADHKVFKNWKLVSIKNEKDEEVEKYKDKIGTTYPSSDTLFGLIDENGVTLYLEAQWKDEPYSMGAFGGGKKINSEEVKFGSEAKVTNASSEKSISETPKLKTNDVDLTEKVKDKIEKENDVDVYTIRNEIR